MRTTSSGMVTISLPLRLNMTTMVNSRAIERDRTDLWYELVVIPLLRDKAQQDHPCQNPGDARNSQVDEDALGNLPDRDIDHGTGEPEKWRQDRHEQPGVDAVEQYLEDRVEGHEAGSVLGRPLGNLVPDDHHGDAAGEADHDQADHVLGFVRQEDDRQREHQDRPDDPVLKQRQAKDFLVDEDVG
jgi:hypothetical protein